MEVGVGDTLWVSDGVIVEDSVEEGAGEHQNRVAVPSFCDAKLSKMALDKGEEINNNKAIVLGRNMYMYMYIESLLP